MSTYRSCDYCGEPIEAGTPYASLSVRFSRPEDARLDATVGDYHFSRQHPCYQAMSDAVMTAHEFGGAIQHIPVASGAQIGARKRKHTKPPLAPPAPPADDDGPDAGTREVVAR